MEEMVCNSRQEVLHVGSRLLTMEVSAAHRAHTENGHRAPVNRLQANIWYTDTRRTTTAALITHDVPEVNQ